MMKIGKEFLKFLRKLLTLGIKRVEHKEVNK